MADHPKSAAVRTEVLEDTRRWQRYLESGKAISSDDMRAKLRRLANEAAKEAQNRAGG